MIETTVGVEGMMCGMCEAHVNDAIRNAFEVKKVKSSHANKQTIIYSETELDVEKLKGTIAAMGYDVTSVESKPYKRKKFLGIF